MQQRSHGWWYPWAFVAGMLVVIAVNAVMITFAVRTFPGLETADAYRKGLDYNQTIAAADAQERQGWHADLRVATPERNDDSRRTELLVRFTDRDGNPLSGLDVETFLIRPTHQGIDRSTRLEERGGGMYQGVIEIPLPGQWDARIHAARGDMHFQMTRRIVIP
jgi:nitrogen fixation protein FixH